ncbi:MAG: Murein DD-endopeptidase MepM [candidate division WS2 bacterium]|uniref:Murein DD-endopeptidase MepM n=1 Tax=Psychracetigena formicireducens TaxID=2986056 RepID=A0A9E2BFD0_PSYF1|nr:Murein DD-endopeptidase MepM [Candidatus Psychracetigena formicireducens]MBT9144578.1 Murein DD-endopeptidase MepM [Candidatus Psychracetigena formicireducens]MBT9150106.1 Murein DD-endopeptidase MepM [Candidatus Psychracetigena formicireducens]
MDNERLTIHLLPHSEGETYRITLKRAVLKNILLSLVSVWLIAIISAVTLLPLYLGERSIRAETNRKLELLESQNRQLAVLLASVQEDSEVIKTYLDHLSKVEEEVRKSLKLGPTNTSLEDLLSRENTTLWSVSRGALEERILALPEVMTRLTQEAQDTELKLANLQDATETILEVQRRTPDIYPLSGPIVSHFGWRRHPIWGGRDFHRGVDIMAPYGSAVRASAEGKVIDVGYLGSLGLTVTISHRDGISTVYAHLSKRAVKENQLVSKGQIIGFVGTSGFSTGPHLHYEVRLNGNPVDPIPYLP